MHEMGIVAEVISTAQDEAAAAGASRVLGVRLRIGELTAVVPDSLTFAWEALTPGTALDGAVLDFVMVRPRSRCLECGDEFVHERDDRRCPRCRSAFCEVLEGRELFVDSIEIDVDEPDDGTAGER